MAHEGVTRRPVKLSARGSGSPGPLAVKSLFTQSSAMAHLTEPHGDSARLRLPKLAATLTFRAATCLLSCCLVIL